MSIDIYVNDKANNLQFNLIFKFKKTGLNIKERNGLSNV